MNAEQSDFYEQEAITEIINDWITDRVFYSEHFDNGYQVEATIELFIVLSAFGKTELEACLMLRMQIFDRPSTMHNIVTNWLYSELLTKAGF